MRTVLKKDVKPLIYIFSGLNVHFFTSTISLSIIFV